jgi:hypothetical protein
VSHSHAFPGRSAAQAQRSVALQIRELSKRGVRNDPGSAAQHFVLRC